ncbi:MliC family protein [Billgrantia kenyensis]|uniref:C-type lysozyme, inhibitor n=1 Tax=Billgrantia kenyensis TaxID=321266 RepID=A0A7W0AFF6_9GAMM|nr:MliC family protein [Halomonas kenyensis]MBA2780564.1 MliC family protein [Halomonas kenyensis]MCG6663257.1 C-type lysozyme, inhibitor [Halomonas kenyensis]
MTSRLSPFFRPALLATASLLLTGCAAAPIDGPSPATAQVESTAPLLPSLLFPGGAESFEAWRCTPQQDLVTAFGERELRLWSAHGGYRLAPAVVASGARYQQGDLSFWNKGGEAVVESANGRLDCSAAMARPTLTREQRPGVMFHGRGNEPGWHVNLAHDTPTLTLVMDYGTREETLPYRVTAMDNAGGRVALASGLSDRPFEMRLEARACFDDMSGEPFPARVTLTIDGETYRGCGQGIAP